MSGTPGSSRTPGAQSRGRATQYENLVGRTLRNGEYIIEAILGQGGMGRVLLASHTTLFVPVAIKQGLADQPIPEIVLAELDRLLHTDNLLRRTTANKLTEQDFPLSGGVHTDRFLREALLLARLQHASLPVIYDYFIEDGYWYLVMDYIPGPTLSAYMHKHAPLQPLEALNYAMQLCDVLEYLHKQTPPVVFRDLKPSNIILSPDGRVMLVDFGIARYFKAGQMNDTAEFGSPGYAPPEQYKGEAQTDGRSDLYSLGVILHEMLSGHHPVGMGRKLEALHFINPAISPVLSGLVTVATRSGPANRFQSAHNFYLALERAYMIEERRTYQQSVIAVGANEPPQWLSTLPPSLEGKTQDVFQSTVHMTERQQVREALQEVHRERLEQEKAEIHLASIDESLQHRTSIGFTPRPLPITGYDEQEDGILTPRSSYTARRIIQAIFGLALLVFMLTASLNIYGFFSHPTQQTQRTQRTQHTPAVSHGQSAHITPGLTRTAIENGTWQILPSLSSPEADNTAIYVQVQGRAYIYMNGSFRGPQIFPHYDANLYRYDIAAAHWEMLSNQNFPVMVNNAVALDEQNHLFFTSGYSPGISVITSFLYMYQPATGTLQKIVPPSQVSIGFGAAMVADHHGHLYITQGFMSAGNPRTQAGTGWYLYDIASGQWHVLAPLPAGLGYGVLALDNASGILLLGGSMDAGQSSPTRQIYHYDIAHNAWTTEQATSPAQISGASSCLNGPEQLVIVGGYDPISNKTSGRTWLVDLHTLRWLPLASLPSGGSLLGTAACDGAEHVFLTRGANDPSRPTPDFWELTIKAG